MRRLFTLFVAAGFAALLSQQAYCEVPSRPRIQERRNLMQRLRQVNEELREATERATKHPDVVKAFKAVRAAGEALRKAEQHAHKLLGEAIIKANPDLAEAAKERRALWKRVAERRRRFSRRWLPGWRRSEDPQEERKPVQKDAGPDVGQEAPDFSLRALEGEKTVTLSDLRRKKPVVLIFGSYT